MNETGGQVPCLILDSGEQTARTGDGSRKLGERTARTGGGHPKWGASQTKTGECTIQTGDTRTKSKARLLDSYFPLILLIHALSSSIIFFAA